MEQVIYPVKRVNQKPDSRIEVMDAFDKTNWTPITFGEVCRNINVTEKDPFAFGIERYVGLEHIDSNSLHIKSWGNVAEGTTFTKKFSVGHVLFGKRRAYLRKAAIADFDGICSGDILVFEANEDVIDPNLFPFLVQSDRFFDFAIQTSAGSLSPRTKFQDLAKFEFLLPPKEQQAKLAELLWAADDIREKYFFLNKSLRANRNTLINGALRKYESNYSKKKLGDLANFIGGYAFKSNEFSTEKNARRQVLKIANVTSNGIDLSKVPAFIADSGYDQKYLFGKDDIIISLTGSNGKRDYGFAVINETDERFWVNQRIAIIRANPKRVFPKFLYYLMKEDIFLDQFFINAIGTANQANVSMKDIQKIQLPVPTISDQEGLVAQLDKIVSIEIELVKLTVSAEQILKHLINRVFS